MRSRFLIIAILLFASNMITADDPKAQPKTDVSKTAVTESFKWPLFKGTQAETVDAPGLPPILYRGVYCVIETAEPYLISAEPPDAVEIMDARGPMPLLGRFCDDDGKIKQRGFKGPNITIILAKKSGPVTIMAAKVGETDRAKIERKLLTVNVDNDPDNNNPTPLVTPTDTASRLKVALSLEPADERATVYKWAQFYKDAVNKVDSNTTWVGLFQDLEKSAVERQINGTLFCVQRICQIEMKKNFPKGDVDKTLKIDDAGKAQLRRTFSELAAGLDKLKP